MGNINVKQNKLNTPKFENKSYNIISDSDIYDDDNNIDYCYDCDDIIIKYYFKHCLKCNKCHNKCKQSYCELCNLCIDPFNDFDIIKHRKLCEFFKYI